MAADRDKHENEVWASVSWEIVFPGSMVAQPSCSYTLRKIGPDAVGFMHSPPLTF